MVIRCSNATRSAYKSNGIPFELIRQVNYYLDLMKHEVALGNPVASTV
jgi:hypothetical protein